MLTIKMRNTIYATTTLLALSSTAINALELKSADIAESQQLNAEQVFMGFGCEGGNMAPALSWSSAPEGTKSFALTVYNPDAPTGSGWWHWFAFDIPADATSLPKGGALPAGAVTLKNDFGAAGFGGACPPPGEVHRYQFTLHALGTKLELDPASSNALAGFMVNANRAASDTITAVYNR